MKENEFDLEENDEMIIEDEELPELPTDYNVFSSVSTDDNLSYSHPPPFSNFIPDTSPPPDNDPIVENNFDKSESPEPSDVAKEKESCEIDYVGSQHQVDQVASVDDKLDAISNHSLDNNLVVEQLVCDEIDDKKAFVSPSLPYLDDKIDDSSSKDLAVQGSDLQSNDDENRNEISLEDKKLEPEIEFDDFNEFIEAVPSESQLESSNALTREEVHEDNSELDDFTSFSNLNIPEPIPELADDVDDDFNDFETAIPSNRQVEQLQTFVTSKEENPAPLEFQFEADFSSFNAFSEPSDEPTFDEFQDFKAAGFSNSIKDLEDNDDDDFGDFSDFTQAPAPIAIQTTHLEVQPIAFVKPENVNGIIDMMFPPTTSTSQVKSEALDDDYTSEQQVIKSDNFVNKFNDFDSTLALGYLYNNSKASQTLVKALGIDTRNIVSS